VSDGIERGAPDLLLELRQALREDHPIELLAIASSLLAAFDPRGRTPFEPDPEGMPSLEELVGSFIEFDVRETTALLTVLAELLPNELLVRRIRRELAGRRQPLPHWLRDLTPLALGRTLVMSDVLADGENIIIEARTAAGHDLTSVAYVDHNLGTVTKDAFVIAESLDAALGSFDRAAESAGTAEGVNVDDLDPAEARARLDEAIGTGAITYPPFETETWPACRPLLEWVVGHLPEGGTGYVRPEWDEDDRAELTARFFASPHGRGHDEDDEQLFESILWFACDYGPGDPLRWSPVAVEIILADWIPRKIVADEDFLARAPDLLRSFIRFAHEERGIPAELTEQTLAAVDRWEPQYLEEIAEDQRPQGPAALFAAMGVWDDEEVPPGLLYEPDLYDPWDPLHDLPAEHREAMLEVLGRRVGGEEVLDALDAEPLPDEPFDRDRVPEDIRDRVDEVLHLVDRSCEELLGLEHRTAARRLLVDVAAGDPAIFRRRGRAETAAAAIVWIVGKVNDAFDPYLGGLQVGDLSAWFGIKGAPSQRAETMLRAISVEGAPSYAVLFIGTPRYFVSDARREIVELRDAYLAMGD
jgi:hypothetical protein